MTPEALYNLPPDAHPEHADPASGVGGVRACGRDSGFRRRRTDRRLRKTRPKYPVTGPNRPTGKAEHPSPGAMQTRLAHRYAETCSVSALEILFFTSSARIEGSRDDGHRQVDQEDPAPASRPPPTKVIVVAPDALPAELGFTAGNRLGVFTRVVNDGSEKARIFVAFAVWASGSPGAGNGTQLKSSSGYATGTAHWPIPIDRLAPARRPGGARRRLTLPGRPC
jgi:hypothetical protein